MNRFSLDVVSNWLARMAAADGVVSNNEINLFNEFAQLYGADADKLVNLANSYAKSNIPEVEYVSPSEMKGRKFENFVVSLLADKSKFKLLSWRGDKIVDGICAEDDLLPDLRILHKLGAQKVEYLVECKFRSKLNDGIIDLSTQLGRYRRMKLKRFKDYELFFAIGIGGQPSNPETFFIIPDRMIRLDYIIKIKNFSRCQCGKTPDAFHNYIKHYFEERIFKNNHY